MAYLCVLVSMKFEAEHFLYRLDRIEKRRAGRFTLYEGKLGGVPVRVVRTGAGESILDPSVLEGCSFVLSTGLCGALTDVLRTGDVVIADELAFASGRQLEVILEGNREEYPFCRSALLGIKQHGFDIERITGAIKAKALESEKLDIKVYRGRTVTVSRLIGKTYEKRRLGVHFQALACSMEDFFRAAQAGEAGVPFFCARVVLDELLDEVPIVKGVFVSRPLKAFPLLKKMSVAHRIVSNIIETVASISIYH